MQEMQRHGFDPWVGEIPQRRAWPHTAVILTGWFHGGLKSVGHDWGSKQWPQQIFFHPFILNPLAFLFDVSSGFLKLVYIWFLFFIFYLFIYFFTEMTISLLKIGSRILTSAFIPSSWAKIPSSIIDFVFQFFRAVLELNEKHRVFRQATQAGYTQWGHKQSAPPQSTE